MLRKHKGTWLPITPLGSLYFKDAGDGEPPKDAGGAPPPAAEPPKVEPPKGEPPPKAAAAPPAKEPEKVELSGGVLPDDADDEELEKFADKDGYIKFPIKAFKTRINRATKKVLKSIFGTDDRDAIIAQKDEYEKVVTAREKERREKLEESARLKEDLKKSNDEKDALKAEYLAKDEARAAAEGAADVKEHAGGHVAEQYVRFAYRDFKKHVRGLSDDEADKLASDAQIGAWFEKWAKENPAMAKGKEEPGKPKVDDKAKKVGASNGGKDDQRPPPPGSGNLAGKTPRPGQANSMNKAELNEYMRSKGLRGHY